MDIETTFAGKMKLLSLTLSGLVVLLTVPSLCHQYVNKKYSFECDADSYSKEKYFLAISCIALILSFLLILATILNIPKKFRNWLILDIGYHLLMTVLLLLGWILFVASVSYTHKWISTDAYFEIRQQGEYKSYMARRCFALIFQLLNIMVHLLTAFFVFKNRSSSG